jgi:hypothetical protein
MLEYSHFLFLGENRAVEKRSSTVLRCKPHRGAFIYIRLAVRFFARLASEHIVKPTAFSGKEGVNL